MRWSCLFFSSPRQYAAALRISLNAGIRLVVGRCGPRHRSFHASSPVAVEVVVDGQLAGADLGAGALGASASLVGMSRPPLSPISSSL